MKQTEYGDEVIHIVIEKIDIELQVLIDYIENQDYNFLNDELSPLANDIQSKLRELKIKLIKYKNI